MNEVFKLLELCYTEGIAFEARYDLQESTTITVDFDYGLRIKTTAEETILLTKYSEPIIEVDMCYKDNKTHGCLILFSILKYQIEKRKEKKAKEHEEYKDL